MPGHIRNGWIYPPRCSLASLMPNEPVPLSLLSVIIPARDEEESLPSTLQEIHDAFNAAGVPHELHEAAFLHAKAYEQRREAGRLPGR